MKLLIVIVGLMPLLSLAQYKVAIDENYVKETGVAIIDDLTEAYRRLGIDAVFEVIPGERAVQKSIKGDYQALDARFLNPDVFFNLIPVQESIYLSHHINAYSLKDLGNITKYQDLENYVVAFPRGVQIKKKITNIVPNLQTFESPSFEILVKALKSGRADIIVMSGEILNVFISKELTKDFIKLNNEPLDVITTHHHLHESYSYLEPELSKIFREMKAEGYFQLVPK
ncbi:substrate-binding periplasmic protein [Marinicellulosiphila megalodicopiae]|uniref:substrate-binding periplasmic protein n=1 Tax=Marinicellulosiphila megalodicopiae TaxID=2724896 RepID=UPI003BAFE9C6